MKKSRNYFLLALLLHILLFSSVTVSFLHPPPPYQSSSDSDSQRVLPAYVYHEEKNNPAPDAEETPPSEASASSPSNSPQSTPAEKTSPDSSKGAVAKQEITSDDVIALKKEDPAKTSPSDTPNPTTNPTNAKNQKASKKSKSTQNVNQDIAAKKGEDNLLLKLLSQATAAKLVYPKIAEDFRLRGTVKLKFLLEPNGRVSQVSLVETSGSTILDQTALDTIRAISPVAGVDKYIQQPKFIHAGIIFGDEKSRQFESFG